MKVLNGGDLNVDEGTKATVILNKLNATNNNCVKCVLDNGLWTASALKEDFVPTLPYLLKHRDMLTIKGKFEPIYYSTITAMSSKSDLAATFRSIIFKKNSIRIFLVTFFVPKDKKLPLGHARLVITYKGTIIVGDYNKFTITDKFMKSGEYISSIFELITDKSVKIDNGFLKHLLVPLNIQDES